MQEKTAFRNGYAAVNGIEMYYEMYGSGKIPLVLIHGGGSTIESNFGNILPLFAADRQIIAVELQAHGRTSDRNAPSSFEQDADDVAALVRQLEITEADFLGFSNGGNTAMQIGIRHPEMVRKLVIASSFYKRSGMISGFFEGMDKASLDNMPAPLKEAYIKVAQDPAQLQVMFDRDKFRMIEFKDWEEDSLRSIQAQTMLVVGNQDVITVDHTVEMSKIIPKSQLVILPGFHGEYLGEVCAAKPGSKVPELFVALVEEFLAG